MLGHFQNLASVPKCFHGDCTRISRMQNSKCKVQNLFFNRNRAQPQLSAMSKVCDNDESGTDAVWGHTAYKVKFEAARNVIRPHPDLLSPRDASGLLVRSSQNPHWKWLMFKCGTFQKSLFRTKTGDRLKAEQRTQDEELICPLLRAKEQR